MSRKRPVLFDGRRMFERVAAAAYVSLTEAEFEGEVVAGNLPDPVLLGGKEVWDKHALDEHLDRLSGRGRASAFKQTKLYARLQATAR